MENLTVIVPFYNGHKTIHKLVNSIPRTIPILIVNDKSDVAFTQEHVDRAGGRNIRVIQMARKGYFAGAVNRGIQETETDILVLNQDSWFTDDTFFEAINTLRNEFAFFGERIRGDHPAFGSIGYVHGTCMFIRRDTIREVGLLDEKNYPLWGNTAEYQWRVARKNFKIFPMPEISGFHHERSATERFGSSIKNLLEKEPDKKELLVRTPPLVSVIVPCYNYGRYISDCINSLIGGKTSLGEMPGQTIQSFEIIIVDDASTDNSMEYIRNIVDPAKGIRAYHLQKNVGTARTLNFGIHRAVGKYITFLSADDMREPDSIEKLIDACEKNPHSFAYDDVWIVNKHERIKKWQMEEYDFEKLIWKNQIHAGILFPKEAWLDTGGYPSIMGDGREDWAFNVALGIHGWCGVHVKNYGYLYRREGQNRTEKNTTEAHRQNFLEKIMSLFPDIYRGNRPMACCGKGSNKQKNVGINRMVSTGSMIMGAKMVVGSEGMERLEYMGNQMSFTAHGEATNERYMFGKDRPRGWVDRRDLGERGGNGRPGKGFLGQKKPNGEWLYRVIDSEGKQVEQEPVVAEEVVVEKTVKSSSAVSGSMGVVEKNIVPGSMSEKTSFEPEPDLKYDPKELTVSELKDLENQGLTRDEWEAIYKAEMKGLNRKGAVAFIEELLANWQE